MPQSAKAHIVVLSLGPALPKSTANVKAAMVLGLELLELGFQK